MSIDQVRHRTLGYTVQGSIDGLLHDLSIDEVGMWQIVPKGRVEFGLTGADLEDFVRAHVAALVEAGGRPLKLAVIGGEKIMLVDKSYGASPSAIVERVMMEWIENPIDPDVGGLWFGTAD